MYVPTSPRSVSAVGLFQFIDGIVSSCTENLDIVYRDMGLVAKRQLLVCIRIYVIRQFMLGI